MSARQVVTSRIAEQARRFPDWLNAPLETSHLDGRDAALAAAIHRAVTKRWLSLVAVIESQLSRPWAQLEFKLQAALLVGAAQLLLLERLPDHAVIHESVEWTKKQVRPKAGGMVNAVLRKVAGLRQQITSSAGNRERSGGVLAALAPDEFPLHDGRVWRLHEAVFDQQPIGRLAQQTSHAVALISHWLTAFGAERTAAIACHDLVQPPTILHGIDGVAPEDESQLQPHDEPGFFVFQSERDSLPDFLAKHPRAIIQDSTSAAVIKATADLHPPPRTIIDLCAGMGTKTRQLAQTHPQATVIATDIAEQRLDVLREQFKNDDRMQVLDHQDLIARSHSELAGTADLVLLDVPCSNTGVLARRAEAKYRFCSRSLKTIVDLQRSIVNTALPLLSQKGRLAYSTCSIESAENQEQARWISRLPQRHWHITRERLQLPTGQPGDPPSMYRDGGYYAILAKSDQ